MYSRKVLDDLTVKFAFIFLKVFPRYLWYIYIFKDFLRHLSVLTNVNFSNISKEMTVIVAG